MPYFYITGPPCQLELCDSTGTCNNVADLDKPDIPKINPIRITNAVAQGPCCWAIYEKENFSGNYQIISPGGNETRKLPFPFAIESMKWKSVCRANPFHCVNPPVCTMYNEENAPDLSNPLENLVECDPNVPNDCEKKTEGRLGKCHRVSFRKHVCIPLEREACDENNRCKPIGNIHSGQLGASCQDGFCKYGRGIIIS